MLREPSHGHLLCCSRPSDYELNKCSLDRQVIAPLAQRPTKRPAAGDGPRATPEQPCLWNVVTDPAERHEVAADNPKVVATLTARLAELSKGFAPDADFNQTGNFCEAAKGRGGFCGPWVATAKQEL